MGLFDVIRQANAPGTFPTGIGGDENVIWHCQQAPNIVYELSIADFSVVRSAAAPATGSVGIGGTATRIWYCEYTNDLAYRLSTTDFSVVRSGPLPGGVARGIGGDLSKIWHSDAGTNQVYELAVSDFAVVRQVALIGTGGIGGDSTKIWQCAEAWARVRELSIADFSVLHDENTPGARPTGIGGNASKIWHCDSTAPDQIYELGTIAVIAPTVTTDPATNVEAISATLNGTLGDDGGEACDCGFEWGLTAAYGNTTPTQSKTTGQSFSWGISGLSPSTLYHFRAFATNAAGTSYGADRTFVTLAIVLPTITTDPATDVEAISATLNGTLGDDGGDACDCGFEWGLTAAYGNTTPTQSKTTGQSFSWGTSGLSPGTLYHFRAFATNAAGTSYGADRTFTTDALPPAVIAPDVTTNPATGII